VAGDDGEKQFPATPQRREQYRKKGQFARSRDAGPVASTFAVVAIVVAGRGAAGDALDHLFQRTIGDLSALAQGNAPKVVDVALNAWFTIAFAPMIGATLAGVILGLAQAGLRFDWDMLTVDFERMNPLPKLQRLVSPQQGLKETALSFLRIGVVGYVGYRALRLEFPRAMEFARLPLSVVGPILGDSLTRVILTTCAALAIIAIVDYAQSRYFLEKEMMMSRQEITDEQKNAEGDQKAKGRMRARARQLAKKRSLQNIKTADVVVTNPTHIAIGIRYSDKDPAPIVVAKGQDDFALLLRREARRHGIPIVENKPLARALDAEVALGKPVPQAHFIAVARVLAFVYRLRPKARNVRVQAPWQKT
jgi:flagellar biosynthetic protein FlhB